MLTRMRTPYKIQLRIPLRLPLPVFMMLRRCHHCTLSRRPPGLHTVKGLAPVFMRSLTIYTAVARHPSQLSMGAHSSSYAQPQYYNANGYHCPSPNPPPYTEYATELNRAPPLRHTEAESNYWTTVGGDTSRYHGGHVNRHVLLITSSIDDYMRLPHLASIKNITTICNMDLTIPTHPIPPVLSRSPCFPRVCPHFPIRRRLPRLCTPRHLHLLMRLTSVQSLKRSSAPSQTARLFTTIIWTSLAVSSSVRRPQSTSTPPSLRDVTGASVYHDILVLTPSNFRPANLSHRRNANP